MDNVGLNDKRVQVEAFLFAEGGRRIADASSGTQNLEDNENDDFELFLTIPIDSAEIDPDDSFDLIVKAFDDENERLDCVQDELSLKIDLEPRKVIIREENTEFLNPFAVCGDTVFATVEVLNIGDKDNDNVQISIKNSALGISETSNSFSLESFTSREDNKESRQFQINIPKDAKGKEYRFNVMAKYDGGSTSTTLPLEVSCSEGLLVESIDRPVILTLNERRIVTQPGALVSIPVEIENNKNQKMLYFVSLKNVGEFAEQSLKSLTLNPGQKSTLFIDLLVREDAEPLTYTGVIEVRTATETVASDTITVDVVAQEVEQATVFEGLPLWFWVIINVVIILLIGVGVFVVVKKK